MSWYKYNALVRIPIFLALLNDSIWTIALDAELPAGLGRQASKGSSLLLDDEVSEMPKEVFSTSTSRRRTGEFKASDLKHKLDSSDSDPSSNEAGHLTARLEVATTPKVVDGSETAKDVDDIAGEGSGLSSDNASLVDEHHGSKGVSSDIENGPGKTTNQSMGTVRRNPEDSESTGLNQSRTENVKSSDVDQIENKTGISLGDSTVYGALFLSASRFNHSCRPNRGAYPRLYFTRSVSQSSTRKTQRQLEFYLHLFTLSDESGTREQSDQRITRIAELKQLYEIDPNFSTGDAEELLHLYKMEKLPWGILDSHLTAAKVYNSQLNSAKVIEHAEKYKSLGLMLIGTGWSGLAEANLLTQQAEKHPSHLTP
ncbi:hypothetical protein KEM48_011556 [Puccinia striiformis f. sp. tritici PST-130]|nr:hypothetical protein KEM48_011556 [Puccinia striiformis f. sp. tritici PST-130]